MSTWQKTKVANLLRHRGGRYYGRFHIGGKPKFIALKTDDFKIARKRLAEKRVEIEKRRQATSAIGDGTCTMGDLLHKYLAKLESAVTPSAATRMRYKEQANYIVKTWPGFEKLRPEQITADAISEWRDRALTTGTGYTPPGAKRSRFSGKAPGTFNKSVDKLNLLLDAAVAAGAISHNPFRKGTKVSDRKAKPTLPDSRVIASVFEEIEHHSGRAGRGLEIADFLRFLAFTGCRLNEVRGVTWNDVDLARGIIRVGGTKTETSDREVPMIPQLRDLLAKIRDRRERGAEYMVDGKPHVPASDPVLAVREANKSLERACKKVGIKKLTHHSLRDLFTTMAIESGVDIPTVAAWLGHADGGALLMRTYAAHRRAHSVRQAAKVKFGDPG